MHNFLGVKCRTCPAPLLVNIVQHPAAPPTNIGQLLYEIIGFYTTPCMHATNAEGSVL